LQKETTRASKTKNPIEAGNQKPSSNADEKPKNRKTEKPKNRKTEKPKNRKTEKPKNPEQAPGQRVQPRNYAERNLTKQNARKARHPRTTSGRNAF
jgi:hypothetical protein